MIQEDYTSFEVAKLLKEKGFDEKTLTYYEGEILVHGEYFEWNRSPLGHISAPTHQMAMKWLREVHNIYIDISPTYIGIEKTIHFIWQVFDSNYDGIGDCEIFYGKYEKACGEAIKFSLENLI